MILSAFLVAAIALLIAAVLLPVSQRVRVALFVLLGGVAVSGIATSLLG
jgi:hypothetical protein